MNAVMRSEKLGIAGVGIGGRGACLDFLYILVNAPDRGAPTTTDPLATCQQANATTALIE